MILYPAPPDSNRFPGNNWIDKLIQLFREWQKSLSQPQTAMTLQPFFIQQPDRNHRYQTIWWEKLKDFAHLVVNEGMSPPRAWGEANGSIHFTYQITEWEKGMMNDLEQIVSLGRWIDLHDRYHKATGKGQTFRIEWFPDHLHPHVTVITESDGTPV